MAEAGRAVGGCRRGPTVFLVLAGLLLVGAFLMVREQLTALVLALTVGYLLHPLYRRLERRLPRKWPAAAIVLLLVAVVLIAPFVAFGLLFLDDARQLIESVGSIGEVEEEVEDALEDSGVPPSQVERYGNALVERSAEYLQGMVMPLVTSVLRFLVGLLVFFILLFFVLVDGKRLVAYLGHVLPAPDPDVRRLLGLMGARVKAIFYGIFLVSVLQGFIAFLGWVILGLPAPFFWGFVMTLLAVVPVLGPFVVLLPAAVWAFLEGDMVAFVGLLVMNFVMVGLVDDVIRPYIVGRSSGVHPGIVLLGIIGGIPLFGLGGLLLGPLLLGLAGPVLQAWSHPEDRPFEDGEAPGSSA